MWQSQPDRAATAPLKGGGTGEHAATDEAAAGSSSIADGAPAAAEGTDASATSTGTFGRPQGQLGGARAAAHAATDNAEGRLRMLWTGAALQLSSSLRSQPERPQFRRN